MSYRSFGITRGLAGVLLLLGLMYGACQVLSPSVEEQIVKACEEQNRGCPKMVDPGLRLDSVTAGANKLMLFKYTLTDVSIDKLDVDKFRAVLETELNAGAKKDPNIQFLLKEGAVVQYLYYDMNNVLLDDFVLKQ